MEFIQSGRRFDFMSKRRYFIGASLLLLVLSIVSFWTPGLKLGTDFKGGTEVEVALTTSTSPGDVRAAVHRAGFESPDVVSIADARVPNHFLIRVQEVSALSEEQSRKVRHNLCFFANDADVDEARCPAIARASEVRISPGGDKISMRYEAPPDLAAITAQLQGIEGVKLRAGEAAVVVVSDRDHKVDAHLESKGEQLMAGLRQQLGAEVVPERALRIEWIGPKAGAQLRNSAISSVVITLLFVMAYVAFRFDLRFAPGGIVALVHDVGIALGAMAITHREITISTVAAMLTIVGYSINDTVIVYDRIRENLARHRGMSFAAVINLSISEMLGRTIITSGVTALSMLAFLWWGTGVLKDFAFALLVGIAVGTYSSIYIAAPITEWIDHRFFHGTAAKRKAISRSRAAKRADSLV